MENISVNKDKCIGCGLCVSECTMHTIKLENTKAEIISPCIGCGHCYAICPENAINWEFTETPLSSLSEIIYKRRSVRQYKNKPIEKEIINKLITGSSAYPSATNQKATEITIITSPQLLKEIKLDVMTSLQNKFKLLNYGIVRFFAKIILGNNYERILKYKNLFDSMDEEHDGITFNAPCLVFVHGEKDKIFIDEDCHYVAYNMVLLGTEMGLGSCFMGFVRGYISQKMKEKLNIPKNHKILSVFTLGYPDVEFQRPVLQKTLKHKIL